MFLINVLTIFSKLDFIRYIFGAFGFFGVNLCVRKLVLNRGL